MESFVEYMQQPNKKANTKLWHIAAFDFGIPSGKTCVWKTRWCRELCYGPACSGARFPKTRPGWLQRLRFIQYASPGTFHDFVLAYARYGDPLRFGRFGDANRPEVVEAIIDALRKTKAEFMWPTRAWRNPAHPSWQLIDKYLHGQVICSVDESNFENKRLPQGWTNIPPPGYPISYIATRKTGFLPYLVQRMGYDMYWCPHYPHPGMRIFERACQNCYDCLLCYAPYGDKGRPNVVYLHHSTKGHTTKPPERFPYPKGHFRKLWLQGKRWDIQPGSLKGLDTEEEIVVTSCGILTPDGWYAPDDDA